MTRTPPLARTRIIVLDDDPTGSQTVHGCLLLTRWDVPTLLEGLRDSAPLFFILTNTRGMSAPAAAALTREVCRTLRSALDAWAAETAQPPSILLVSRSDSTLRGHYPVETEVMAEELGPFAAHFLVPAFIEAGRITVDSTHWVVQDGQRVPVHATEFARDSVFAFRNSYLPAYVEEKTQGRLPADAVQRITLNDLRNGDLRPRLRALQDNACVVVDAEVAADLDLFARQVLAVAGEGQRFLFRSAASLLTALADLPEQPVPAHAMAQVVRNGQPGVILVGSHVQKTTQQLERLLAEEGTQGIEIDVDRIDSAKDLLQAEVLAMVERVHAAGQTPVLFTSRTERRYEGQDPSLRLHFGARVSAFLMDIVRNLPVSIGYLISKGGITSNDVLAQGLALRHARVLGQVWTGCSIVRCPENHPRFPDLPVVIFPGNVGDTDALAAVYRRLTQHPSTLPG